MIKLINLRNNGLRVRAVTKLHEKIVANLDDFMIPEYRNNLKKRAEMEALLKEKGEELLMKSRHKMKMNRYENLKEEINSKERTHENKNQYIEQNIENLIKYFDQ